jgi:hypothetical protein
MQAAEAQQRFEICMAESGYDAIEQTVLIVGRYEEQMDALVEDMREAAKLCAQ